MNPREKYGEEFFYRFSTFRKSDNTEVRYHDIVVCISPKSDAESTLAFAWAVLRELAEWAGEEFRSRPSDETYRIIVAWSRSVREGQGHIIKIWNDLAGVREIAGFTTPQECSARFGSGWTPFLKWQKDVFEHKC